MCKEDMQMTFQFISRAYALPLSVAGGSSRLRMRSEQEATLGGSPSGNHAEVGAHMPL